MRPVDEGIGQATRTKAALSLSGYTALTRGPEQERLKY